MVLSYGGSIWAYGLEILWGAAVPTIGMYCSLFFTAKLLNSNGHLSKAKWLLCTLAFSVLLMILGVFFLFVLDSFCGSLNSFFK